jgi:molecular chaperone DnaK
MSGDGQPAVGIDLGTTHSAIATATADGRARILADARGARVHPSAVSFHPSGGVLVGADARARRLVDPENTVLGAKRLLGHRYGSPELEQLARLMPLRLERGDNEQVAISTRAGAMTVPEILAMVLDHLRLLAERNLGRSVARAVIAVPANFLENQRVATVTAAAIAGLEVPSLINEPTAAAIAYGARRELERVIAVYDFGGGTFDVSILELRGREYEVLATAGDPFLGGDDLDNRIVEEMAEAFLVRERIDLRQDLNALSRLREAAEELKLELSWRHRAACRLDAIAYGRGGRPLQLVHQMSREQLVQISADLIERTFPVCDEALRRAGLRPDQIGDVVLVGGTTKMPHIRQRVAQHFGRAARTEVDPDGAVALGAALLAAALTPHAGTVFDEGGPTADWPVEPSTATGTWGGGSDPTEISGTATLDTSADTSPESSMDGRLGSELEATLDRSPAADQGSFDGRQTSELTRPREPAPSVDPLGKTMAPTSTAFHQPPPVPAARPYPSTPGMPPRLPGVGPMPPSHHAAVAPPEPAGEVYVPPSRVLDVTSHSLGLVTVAGFCEPIIARNTRVPAEHTRTFTPARENQRSVQIKICQGESRVFAENVLLGHLELSNLPPRPREQAAIEVTFAIDESGVLRVRARDGDGRQQEVQLNLVGAPSPAGVQRARERLSSLRLSGGHAPPTQTTRT